MPADVAERSKICSKCGIVKLKSAFYANKRTKSGVCSECKQCKLRNKRRYLAGNGKEVIARYKKVYVQSSHGKEMIARYRKKYSQSTEGKAKLSTYRTNKYANDPQFRMKQLLRVRLHSALKRSVNGRVATKCGPTLGLLGCSMDFFMKYIQAQFTAGMTWERYGEFHIDHIRPCASFDLTSKEQQKICFHWTNLQPLWAVDNLKKGARFHGPV